MPGWKNPSRRSDQQKLIYIAQINEKANFNNESQPHPDHLHLCSIDFRFAIFAAPAP
jgi:hypothetical protein